MEVISTSLGASILLELLNKLKLFVLSLEIKLVMSLRNFKRYANFWVIEGEKGR